MAGEGFWELRPSSTSRRAVLVLAGVHDTGGDPLAVQAVREFAIAVEIVGIEDGESLGEPE